MDYEIMMSGTVRIGEKAPGFETVSTKGKISLNDFSGKWVILFSHPGDFTPVCTTEIIELAKENSLFEGLGARLVGLSVDSLNSHLAWIRDIYEKTGTLIPFPIIADSNGEVARKYGMISNSVNTVQTVRNVFIIDPEGIVRLILIYPMNVGRNISEIIRSLQGLQTADQEKGSTPVNWMPGQPIIQSSPKTIEEMQERIKELKEKQNGLNWYLTFRNLEKQKNEKIEKERRN